MSNAPATRIDVPTRVREAVAAAEARKALDVKVLHLEPLTSFTDYFLICSGTSERQVQALADAVEQRLETEDVSPRHVEGYGAGRWVLLDYGDFVFHIFTEEARAYYGLDRLWADAPDVTAEFSS